MLQVQQAAASAVVRIGTQHRPGCQPSSQSPETPPAVPAVAGLAMGWRFRPRFEARFQLPMVLPLFHTLAHPHNRSSLETMSFGQVAMSIGLVCLGLVLPLPLPLPEMTLAWLVTTELGVHRQALHSTTWKQLSY